MFAAVVEVVQVRRMIEEVRRDEGDHVGITAGVVAQIKDDRISLVQRSHRSRYSCPADRSIGKLIKFQIADIVRQDPDLFERAVVLLHFLPIARNIF